MPNQGDCSRCYARVRDADAIHDQGDMWHRACRVELIADLAAAKADRLIRRDPAKAAVLVEIQRTAAA